VVVACACGAEWDQDANAARNILASGPVMPESPPALADRAHGGTQRVGRWGRRRAAGDGGAATVPLAE